MVVLFAAPLAAPVAANAHSAPAAIPDPLAKVRAAGAPPVARVSSDGPAVISDDGNRSMHHCFGASILSQKTFWASLAKFAAG
jgi:hypothetical protein